MKPNAPPQLEAPSRLATMAELRAPLDAITLALNFPRLVHAPRGDGRPILLLPGYRADSNSMLPLRGFLRRLGYDARDWELGRNTGNVDKLTARMREVVDALYEERGGDAITLIGWSLGGIVARELARLEPERVREVITMGSPIVGGPKYTAVGRRFADSNALDLDAFEHQIHERNSLGFDQPVTSIYSRFDGVVGWRASIDVYNPQARNIEVASSHFGLGINGTVWRLIADLLAEDR